jgi:hypothetical protein
MGLFQKKSCRRERVSANVSDMFKKFALYLGIAASLPLNAFALVGGPWSAGDYSQLEDDRGIYQASYRYVNGSGFAQWGSNVDLGPQASSSASGNAASTSSTVGSVLNRTLLYYKGITFFGNATGIVDFEAKQIQGMGNAQSEVTLSDQTTTTANNSFFLFGSSNSVQASTSAVNNGGRGFVANVSWTGKISKTNPVLRFTGSGEISFIGASVQPLLSQLAQSIVSSADVVLVSTALAQLSDPAFLAAVTPESLAEVEAKTERVKLKVYGIRRFFLSQR